MKDGYKMSKLGKIPVEWDYGNLGSFVEKIIGGGTPSRDVENYWKGNVPWATVKDLKKLILDDTMEYISEKGLNNSSANLIPANTLITSTRMALGKAVFFTKDVAINQDLKAIFPKKSLDKNYLFHWFFLNAPNILGLGSGSTVKGIRLEVLRGIEMVLPPIKEQQKIAKILSTVDEKITIIDEQLQATQILKKGLMQRLLTKGIEHTVFKESVLGEIPVGWEVVKLDELLKKIVGGGTPSRDNAAYWNGNIPWVTVKDLKKYILNDAQEYISKNGLENSSANLIPAWTLIISTRMALGKAIFYTKDVAINQDLKALFTTEKLDKFFLYHWFFANSDSILNLGSGSTVKGIRLEVLRGLQLALPSIEEQKKIAKILSKVDEKLQVLTDKKAQYQTLKKSLMQKLLTGKIRVKIDNE